MGSSSSLISARSAYLLRWPCVFLPMRGRWVWSSASAAARVGGCTSAFAAAGVEERERDGALAGLAPQAPALVLIRPAPIPIRAAIGDDHRRRPPRSSHSLPPD